MASKSGPSAFSISPHRHSTITTATFRFSFSRDRIRSPVLLPSLTKAKGGPPCNNAFVSEAVRRLGPPARFEASKLTVDFMGQELNNYSRVLPRIYILSHCDFTANLTLTISNTINADQLEGWYSKDDVVAEWKELRGQMYLVIHCYVSGPNSLFADLAAEFRYHIFSKELPLVLQAVLYGDSALFREHPKLMDAVVWVYFHSRSPKYHSLECWGPLKDAAQKADDQTRDLVIAKDKGTLHRQKLQNPGSFLQALFTYFL